MRFTTEMETMRPSWRVRVLEPKSGAKVAWAMEGVVGVCIRRWPASGPLSGHSKR